MMLAAAALGSGATASTHERLLIGLTPVILANQVAFLQKWGQYLSQKVGCEVSFIARDSYQTIMDLLFAGQVDAAWICGYPFVRFESSLSLMAVPLYAGKPTYQAYLIAQRHADPIRGWADLRGKVLAYSDPLSNSGWLVAQTQLAQAGLKAAELKRSFFAHSHRNVAEAVASGLAHAGSIDGYVWETMRQQATPAITQTEVIWKSESFGFPPIATLRGKQHAFQSKLQGSLLNMANDPAGKELLIALNLTGFTTGAASMFSSIRQQAKAIAGAGVRA